MTSSSPGNAHYNIRMNKLIYQKTCLSLLAFCLGLSLSYSDETVTTDVPLQVLGDFPFTPVDFLDENKHRNTKTTDGTTVLLKGTNSSYSGKNVNITNNYSGSGNSYGLCSEKGKYINFGADEGTYAVITTSAASSTSCGIRLASLTEQSYIYNAKINHNGAYGYGMEAFSSVLLDNVHFYLNGGDSQTPQTGYGIYASGNKALVTNKDEQGNVVGTVTITGSSTTNVSGALSAYGFASVDLAGITIDIHQGRILTGGGGSGDNSGGSILLTDSTIISRTAGNTLIATTSWGSPSFTLNNVKILESDAPGAGIAKDQRLYVENTLGEASSINFIRTAFDGYAESSYSSYWSISMEISLSSNSSWNVSRDSNLGQDGVLSLDGSSTISFVTTNGDDFTNINTASIMLANGSILMLDRDSSEFSENQIITLFTGVLEENYTNGGALLVTSDNMVLEYIDLKNGKFQLTGSMFQLIPEPASATLGLAALGAFLIRRRRDSQISSQ